MNGVPVKILRNGEQETIYLSTRRSGDAGNKLRVAKRRYHKAEARVAKLASSMIIISDKADALIAEGKSLADGTLEELYARHEKVLDEMHDAKDKALELAEEVVRLALKENYGKKSDEIMDCLTDRQLAQCVGIIETGQTPADFFQSPDTQPSESGMSPTGDTTSGSSSKKGSQAGTSKKAK